MNDARMLEQHVAAATAAAVAAGLAHPGGRQLMQSQAALPPWVYRYTRGTALPSPLDHGPVELLQRVNELAGEPHASAKLLDDAVILLTYGAAYLQDHHHHPEHSLARLEAARNQRILRRERWARRAEEVRRTWRSQKFHTHRLPPLELKTSEFLQPEVVELMARKRLQPQDSVENIWHVPVRVDEKGLKKQVVSYAAELKKRVDARRRDADEQQRKQLRDQRLQEERRKRMIVQKKKRHENACRRWNYFTTRLIRIVRQQSEREKSFTPPVALVASPVQSHDVKKNADRTQSMLRVFKNPAQRVFVRRFVAKAIARGVSRVLCAYNMGSKSEHLSMPFLEITETTTSTNKVLRLGLLLCDLHFGVKYSGLYQRFFDRVARERGARVEWEVFNCLKAQLPTKAHIRVLNGFLVAGGPNIGVVGEASNTSTASREDDSGLHRRGSSGVGGRKSRHFGHWRQRLLVLLRELHARKQTIIGGLGLGHVILAEALGGRIGMNEWEDGWCLLDPTILNGDAYTNVQSRDRRLGQRMLGVKFLHGEFVKAIGSERSGIKSWRSPGEHNFVACFRDKLTLSMDGSPECGAFVFETLGEFYERDKAIRMRQHAEQSGSTIPKCSSKNEGFKEDVDDDDDDDYLPITLDTALSLEEKRKRMDLTDASVLIAHLFFDHFHRQILSIKSPSDLRHGSMAVSGVVCSSNILRVDESLRHLRGLSLSGGVFMNVTASTDGHFMITNPRAFAMAVDHDRRNKDPSPAKRVSALPTAVSTTTRRNSFHKSTVLTLAMLRDYDVQCKIAQLAATTDRLSPRASIRLPSIHQDGSTRSLIEAATTEIASQRGLVRRASTLATSRLAQAIEDGVSVLTLSQALTALTTVDSKNGIPKPPPKRVFIRLVDEECKQTHDLLPVTKADLRSMWLRLIAAIRIADLSNEIVAIVSRHSLVLDYVKRKRPTWTFVKDCRRSEMTHRKRLKKLLEYAPYADIVLFDQDFLLGNSANENEALLKKAKQLGIQVFVAPKDESPLAPTKPTDKWSPKKRSAAFQKKSSSNSRTFGRLSQEITDKTTQGGTEYDMRVVEFMLLQFSGLDGVITAHPEAAIEAQQRIATKNEAMQQVEQLFRDWQAKDNAKASSPKRTSGASQLMDPALGTEDPEDYVGGDCNYDSDDSIPEHEIVMEMARQWAEHSHSSPLAAVTTGPFAANGAMSLSMASGGLASGPFAPLSPIQQKTGDEVFGIAAMRRRLTSRNFTPPSFTGERSSRLSSIGSFRAALKRANSPSQPSPFGLTRSDTAKDTLDPRLEIRTPEGTDTSSLKPSRPLKPMSSRRILTTPR